MFKACGDREWILAATLDTHICSHYMASNMKPMVDSGAAIPFVPVGMVSHTIVHQRSSCPSEVLEETCRINKGAKLKVTCISDEDRSNQEQFFCYTKTPWFPWRRLLHGSFELRVF